MGATGSSDIMTGLKVSSQIPLHTKGYSQNESALSDLGTGNQLAYSYEQGLLVYCIEEHSRWEWREVTPADAGNGLVATDFTYPDGIICYDIDYSNRTFNFFLTIVSYQELLEIITAQVIVTGTVIRNGEDAPSNLLGANGDYYIDVTTGDLYYKAVDAYYIIMSIKGYPGSVWRNGATVPNNSLGVNGDYYLRTTNCNVYYKIAGVYAVVTNIKGAKGDMASISNGTTTRIAGAGSILDPYTIEVNNLQREQVVTTNYTLVAGDKDYTIVINNNTNDVTITIPLGILATDFICYIIQKGIGEITIVVENIAMIIKSPSGMIKLKENYAWACINRDQEDNPSDNYFLSGYLKA